MKQCATTLDIKGMQLKITIKCHFTNSRMSMIKLTGKSGKTGNLIPYGRNVKYATALENSLAVLQKAIHRIKRWPTLGCIYKRNGNVCSHKNLYINVHSSIFIITKKVKAAQMSTNIWVDQQNMVYLYIGILFAIKKKWSF